MSLSTLGDVMSTLGDVMSTGGYHEYSGDTMSTVGIPGVQWGIP